MFRSEALSDDVEVGLEMQHMAYGVTVSATSSDSKNSKRAHPF